MSLISFLQTFFNLNWFFNDILCFKSNCSFNNNEYFSVFTKAIKAGKLRRELDDVMDEKIED